MVCKSLHGKKQKSCEKRGAIGGSERFSARLAGRYEPEQNPRIDAEINKIKDL